MDLFEIRSLAQEILVEYGLVARGWKVAFDDGKRRAGVCNYRTRTIGLSRLILPNAAPEDVRETILHEVAHALTPGHNHDNVWKAKLRSMGGTGKRTHSMDTPKGRYELRCVNCGVIGHRHQAQGALKRSVNRPERSLHHHTTCGGTIWLVDTKDPRPMLPSGERVNLPTAVLVPIAAANPAPAPVAPGTFCRCGCGDATKGGSYRPGHDARHVSEVFTRWIQNEFDATGAAKQLPTEALRGKLSKRIAAYAEKHYPKGV